MRELLVHKTRIVSGVLGAFAALGGGIPLTGWFANLQRLTDWLGHDISMMPNAAVCALCTGIALVLSSLIGSRKVVAVLGAFVGSIGAATLFQHLGGTNLGIDTLLVYREWGQRGTVVPGRMGLPGSVSWTIIGAALVLMTGGTRMRRAAVVCALLAASIAMLSLVGYLFGAQLLFTIPRLTVIALQTATLIFAIALGIVAAIPDEQPMRTLLGDTTTGLLARRALPFLVFVPLILGLLRVRGQEAELFDTAFGTALLVLLLMGFLMALLWSSLRTVADKEDALRQSEARFRMLADNMAQLAWTCDRLGNVTWYNRRWLDYTGMSFEDLKGREWSKVHHPDHLERVVKGIARSAQTGELWEDTFPLRGQGGGYRWFLSRAVPIHDEQGGVVRWFGTSTDVTEQREAEMALRDSSARLEVALESAQTAARAKDQFLASLSHELRTPLTPVLLTVSMLLEDPTLAPALRESLEMIDRNIEIQARMVNDLLDLTRITSNKLDLQLDECDLQQIVRRALEVCASQAATKGVRTTLRLNPPPPTITADPTRLQQVFWNLIQNAIKFTPTGGEITVTSYSKANLVFVEVADTGRGIEARLLERIFQPFEQGDEKPQESLKGLGLGLSIARRIVQAHGGTLAAKSDGRNRGAVFTVTLPHPTPPAET